MRILLFFLTGLAAAALSWLLTRAVRRLAIRIGAVDQPGSRKIHTEPVPRLGGVAVIAAAVTTFAAAAHLTPWIDSDPLWIGIGVGALPILLVSLIDDTRGLNAWAKGLGHLAGALLAVWLGVRLNPEVHLFGQSIHIGALAWPLSVLWLVGVTSAFNLVDGLDGLSAGLALISAGSLVAVFLLVHQTGVALSVSILAGALLGFLPYNLYPARIFLGDTGATAIGFTLGCLTLRGGSTLSAGFATLLPVIILGLPVAETLLSMVRRALPHQAESGATGVFSPDRSHIHHRLMDRIGHRRAVLALYGVGIVLALTGLLSIILNVQEAGLLLLALLLAGFVGISRLGYQEFAVIRSGLVLRFYDAPVLQRSLFVVFLDLFFVACATYAAIGLKYDDWGLVDHRRLAVGMAAALGPATVVTMWALSLYRGSWRLASIYDAMRVTAAVAISMAAGFLLARPLSNQDPALSLFGIYALVKLLAANGSRLSYRILAAARSRAVANGCGVLVYGAGAGGANAIRQMLAKQELGLRPLGLIDDDLQRVSKAVDGFQVMGGVADLERCIRATGAEAVVLSTRTIPPERVGLARDACARTGARLLRMEIRFDECGPENAAPVVDSASAARQAAASPGHALP